jgi:hypothetical protein
MVDEGPATYDQVTGFGARLGLRVRWIAVRGLAAVATGTVVLGLGGRLVMLGSRLLHPDAIGQVSENGNPIGDFTLDGTIELVVFGGLGSGIIAGVVWVIVWQWIPRHPAVVGFGAVTLGAYNLIDSGNRDFVILGDPLPDLVLLVGLLFGFGACLVWVDRWFDSRLPKAAGAVSIGVYSLIVLVGAPFLIPSVGGFFTTEFCFCDNPPIATGVFIVVTAIATGWWWIMNLRGTESPPTTLKRIGSTSVALAVAAGTVHLIAEIATIL